MSGDLGMRELTIKGFISSYVEELSYSGTSSIIKLVKELDRNPRLLEPLVLHAILSGMPQRINEKNPFFYAEYVQMHNRISNEAFLLEKTEELPERYRKVVEAYKYKVNRFKNDNHTKLLMRERIIQIQYQKGITNYRIYTDLQLNPGNVNSFLKNGAADKLALDVVRDIWNFVKDY